MTKNKTTVRASLVQMNPKKNARQERTPLVGTGSLVAIDARGEMSEVITVRTYWNPKGSGMQPVRASVWLTPFDRSKEFPNGRGDAGGCGYHKESAAIAEALENAGVRLFGELYPRYSQTPVNRVDYKKAIHFGGTGASGYESVFCAVAKALGYKGRMAWVSHGL